MARMAWILRQRAQVGAEPGAVRREPIAPQTASFNRVCARRKHWGEALPHPRFYGAAPPRAATAAWAAARWLR